MRIDINISTIINQIFYLNLFYRPTRLQLIVSSKQNCILTRKKVTIIISDSRVWPWIDMGIASLWREILRNNFSAAGEYTLLPLSNSAYFEKNVVTVSGDVNCRRNITERRVSTTWLNEIDQVQSQLETCTNRWASAHSTGNNWHLLFISAKGRKSLTKMHDLGKATYFGRN